MDKKGQTPSTPQAVPSPQPTSGPVKPFKKSGEPFFTTAVIIFFCITVLLGAATGYLLSQGNKADISGGKVESSQVKKGLTVGSDDLKTFKDKTEGLLKEGGIDGEGQYHLERPGGASQNVYMTSSIVDLSSFVGRKVRVWGETFEGEKAGWLMDVGRLEVLN